MAERRTVSGTVRYMPPEVFDGKSDLKSDVWAVGIMVIEMAESTPMRDTLPKRYGRELEAGNSPLFLPPLCPLSVLSL